MAKKRPKPPQPPLVLAPAGSNPAGLAEQVRMYLAQLSQHPGTDLDGGQSLARRGGRSALHAEAMAELQTLCEEFVAAGGSLRVEVIG